MPTASTTRQVQATGSPDCKSVPAMVMTSPEVRSVQALALPETDTTRSADPGPNNTDPSRAKSVEWRMRHAVLPLLLVDRCQG